VTVRVAIVRRWVRRVAVRLTDRPMPLRQEPVAVLVTQRSPPSSAFARCPRLRPARKERQQHAATQSPQVPQGTKGPQHGRRHARRQSFVRRLRLEIFIRIFPDKPISQKPAEVRMGNGKGNPEYWVAEIQPGKVLYELNGVPEQLAREAFTLAAAKLPLSCTFVARQVGA
jgi:large subunit ribosomal protein L16